MRALKIRICPGMYIFNIGPRAILASLWWRALLEMLPADWMSASRDAHCLVVFPLKSARKRERICRHDRDLQTVSGVKLTPLTGLNRTQKAYKTMIHCEIKW